MTTKSKRLILIIAMLLMVFGVAAIWSYSGKRPTVETKSTVYVVPWPWELEWQDGGFVIRLEVE
ncbi:hypothetical protein [Eubacterium barkeri]|uniref:Uncharacterized protein n=1 Tax=Eubacterium barkeri TaxID=1528 RepID=A0A1H3IPF6_EUBBA|nr:hypothetical protein [Eubacterium barkeri]SDY29713.1 hypothetical protein SAMN04488579_12435 [Eubacterium barkeri]